MASPKNDTQGKEIFSPGAIVKISLRFRPNRSLLMFPTPGDDIHSLKDSDMDLSQYMSNPLRMHADDTAIVIGTIAVTQDSFYSSQKVCLLTGKGHLGWVWSDYLSSVK